MAWLVMPFVAAIVGMGGRAMLAPWLHDAVPFVFALPAVAIVAVLRGTRQAVAATLACAAWSVVPWVLPHVSDAPSLAAFVAAGLLLAWLLPRFARGSRAETADHAGPSGVATDGSVHHRVIGVLRWIVLLSAFLPVAAFVGIGAYQLQARSDDADVRLERISRVAAEHASKVYETNEMLLRRVVDALGSDDDARLVERQPALHLRLKQMTADLPQVQSVWVHDASGRPLLSNRFMPAPRELDVSDREFFRWHREGRGGLFISEALVGRVTGDVFSDLSLRRERADGSFAGLVSVGLFVRYFDRIHAELALDLPGATVSLLRADGRWIARHPAPTPTDKPLPDGDALLRAMAESPTESLIEWRSVIDGTLRRVALRRVGAYPVYAVTGIGRAEVLAHWRRDMAILAAILVPLAIGMVLLAKLALRRAEQGLAAMERLQSETAQRLRVEAALRQSQKLEALGRLTGGVAHDFNNLLTVVNNNAHLIRRGRGRTDVDAQLSAIDRAVRAGTQLTRQLLAFSRRQVVRVETLRLQEQLPGLTVLIRPMLTPGIDLDVVVEPDTAAIEVDRAEFELAILNLVSNARDAMPDGGRLRVAARDARDDELEPRAGPMVVVEVSDTGEGIAPELLERVFEPFFSTKPHGDGTGLGLAQVQELCRRAGGDVRLHSVRGEGTTLTMRFPAVERPSAPIAAPSDATPRTLALRVLLVEDNTDVAVATQEVLETMGCTVRRVADADAALGALGVSADVAASFDVMLSDIAMPGPRDGIALGGWVRRHRPAIGVVLMTGYAERLGKAAEQGLVVLPKPCEPAALAQALWDAHRAALERAAETPSS